MQLNIIEKLRLTRVTNGGANRINIYLSLRINHL